ncbi:MAG: NRDE family protein [Gammaproteobacteria bacterium]|nr:MAG: NRDE family protein [Gammaproteobacteria bacterium]
MCLVFAALGCHPQWPFVALANRDEFFNRPSAPLMRWPSTPEIIAGRDAQAGGTWLGCTGSRFAVVTNVRRHPQPEGHLSRGYLVRDALLAPDFNAWLDSLLNTADHYSGFNLLILDASGLHYVTNRPNVIHRRLENGLYGLSNADLDAPWFKVEQGKSEIQGLLKAGITDEETWWQVMLDETRAPADQLPDTGLPKEFEAALSSRFITLPDYGTRCTTLARQDAQGAFHLTEWSYSPGTGLPASRASRRALSARP